MALVRGVVSKQGTDLSDWINDAASRNHCDARDLTGLFIAESGLDEYAARYGTWPDVSFGLGQQTVMYAPVLGRVGTPADTAYVREYYFDPEHAIDDAARQFGAYYRQTRDWREACARYNGGPRATWASIPSGNRASYERAWQVAGAYVEGGAQMGQWVFPVQGRYSFEDRHWDGAKAVDIFADWGTPLVAVYAGRSVVRDYPLGGHTIHLETDDGYVCYYAHLVQGTGVGGRVARGQVIGQVGNTGNAKNTPPHCHWAVGTASYGIDANGAGNVAPWPLLRLIEKQPEEEDMGRVAELEQQVEYLTTVAEDRQTRILEQANKLGYIQGDVADAIATAIVSLGESDPEPQAGKTLWRRRIAAREAAMAAVQTLRQA